MKQKVVNMTEGNPIKLIIAFAIPMMIGNIFQQFYNLVDSIVVGQLVGSDAFGAIGATGSVTFLFFALCNGIGSGGGVVTSQYFGRGDDDKVKTCIVNVFYIMLVFPVVVGLIAFLLSRPLLELLNTPENMMEDALTYVRMMCLGLVFVSLYNYISSMLRALGDSRTPLYFLIFACILNTILDIVFVKYFHLAVLGAAIATLISQFTSGVLCIIYALKKNPYFKLKREHFKFSKVVVKNAIRIGVPLSLQFSMIAISCMALQRVVNSFGETAVSAFTATSKMEQVIHQPYQTIGAALTTYSGQNFGANKHKRVVNGYKKCIIIMVALTLIIIPILQIFGKLIIRLFVDDAAVIEMGAQAIKITSWFYIFLGMIYVVRGVLNGIGDAFFALINGGTEVFGRFVVPIVLTTIPAIGVWGIWWSVGVVWFFSGLTAWLRYLWIKKRKLKLQASIDD